MSTVGSCPFLHALNRLLVYIVTFRISPVHWGLCYFKPGFVRMHTRHKLHECT